MDEVLEVLTPSSPRARRRLGLICLDVFLFAAICWALFAPTATDADLGPTSGYREPDLEGYVAAQAAASRAVGSVPRPWAVNQSASHGGRRRNRRHKRRKQQQQQREAPDDAGDKRDDLSPGARSVSPLDSCSGALHGRACASSSSESGDMGGRRLVVTLSVGKRSHFAVTQLPMEAYARRVGADFVVVDSLAHPSLAGWNDTLRSGANSHFLKLPMLQYYLRRYGRLLFVDDDVLLSPRAPDVFAAVPCAAVGAVYEGYHAQGWHSMHTRSTCALYGAAGGAAARCSTEGVRSARIFNSGVMVLSDAHLPLLDGWERRDLQCKILCDQLYMNAMTAQHDVCVHDLGNAFNLPGTQVRYRSRRRPCRAAPCCPAPMLPCPHGPSSSQTQRRSRPCPSPLPSPPDPPPQLSPRVLLALHGAPRRYARCWHRRHALVPCSPRASAPHWRARRSPPRAFSTSPSSPRSRTPRTICYGAPSCTPTSCDATRARPPPTAPTSPR